MTRQKDARAARRRVERRLAHAAREQLTVLAMRVDDMRAVLAEAARCEELERRIAGIAMFSAGLRLRNIEAQIVGEQLDEFLALSPRQPKSLNELLDEYAPAERQPKRGGKSKARQGDGMSDNYCEHGVLTCATHPNEERRCYECDPIGPKDLRELREEMLEEFEAKLDAYRVAIVKALGGVP